MKKNWLLVIGGFISYLVVIVLASYFVIIPGVKNIKEANNIKELTYEEKTNLIDEINQKYIDLEKEVISKYEPTIIEVKEKYEGLKKSIDEKYDKEEKAINNDINDTSVAQNKEFFANGLSKKYYELRDQISDLQDKKYELSLKKREEIRSNETNQKEEIDTIENNKEAEINRLGENKENELNSINAQNTNKVSIRNKGIFKIVIGIIAIIIPLSYIVSIFNKLTRLSNSVKEKWSQIDVLLKQRADLIPNIVESIKGASAHEKTTLTNVTRARNQVINATTKEEEIEANKNLSMAIGRLFMLQEDYPELKTNTNFMDLQGNLKELENSISLYRQQYNKAVLKYKNKLEMFPSNVIANIFSFEPELFFEADEEDKENPNISFK